MSGSLLPMINNFPHTRGGEPFDIKAGGGYVLLASPSAADLPAPFSQVWAEEAAGLPGAEAIAGVRSTSAAVAEAVTDPATGTVATTTATPRPTSTAVLKITAPTATATRVIRATATPTTEPTATPDPTADPLPDAGFGEFVQPIAGFALAGVALTAHAIRKRR